MSTFGEKSYLVRMLLQCSSLNKYHHVKQITLSGQPFLISKEEQVLLRILAFMELKDPLILVSQSWKKNFQVNAFVACLLEIHLSYVELNS